MEGFGYATFLLDHDGALPKLIPAGTAIRAGLGADLIDVTRGFGEAGDKSDFLKQKVGSLASGLGMLGPLGLAAGGLIAVGMMLGKDGLDDQFGEMEAIAAKKRVITEVMVPRTERISA